MSEIAPHKCPDCKRPAYIGAFTVECTWRMCERYHEATAVKHWAEKLAARKAKREAEEAETSDQQKMADAVEVYRDEESVVHEWKVDPWGWR